jgi:small subunit ribosomal protein S17
MKADKIRNLTDAELLHQQREQNDQLFRLKFQLNMGQTESLKKIRGLRKDIARFKTIAAESGDEVMAETTKAASRRKTQIGDVVSAKMSKTIVVAVARQKAHPMYRRVVKKTRRFYAHDEQGAARVGDVVKIEETRPLSKLKRWQLVEVVRRAALVHEPEAAKVKTVPEETPEATA